MTKTGEAPCDVRAISCVIVMKEAVGLMSGVEDCMDGDGEVGGGIV